MSDLNIESLPNEPAKKWVKALLSGEYTQGQGALRDGSTFCCLGVLCDVYKKETGKGTWESEDGSRMEFRPPTEGSEYGVLPESVRVWAGLNTNDGGFTGKNGLPESDNLADRNDDGVPFKNIARIIVDRRYSLFVFQEALHEIRAEEKDAEAIAEGAYAAYEKGGVQGVEDYATLLGITKRGRCEPCDRDVPVDQDGDCLVCATPIEDPK
jgi:hypothetical protein